MGFATSIKTDNLIEIAKKINIKVSEKIGTWTFEEALTDIAADEICISKTSNGSIILVGDEFPILETKLRPLSENGNKLLRFMYGETSMVFLFEYQHDGKVLRMKSVHNYEPNGEKGKALEIEFSGMEADEVIMSLIQQVSGDDIYTLEPDHVSIKYKYLGDIENIESPLTTINEQKQTDSKLTNKPWWKFW